MTHSGIRKRRNVTVCYSDQLFNSITDKRFAIKLIQITYR